MPHGGCDPPPLIVGYIVRAAYSPRHSAGVGERKDENGGKKRMCEIHSHTSIVALFNSVFPLKRGIFNFYYEALKYLPSVDNPSAP